MHMRAAWSLAVLTLASASLSGCLGVDGMDDLKEALGFGPVPLVLLPPVARARASTTLADVGEAVAFSAQGSLDPQGLPLSYAWSFGDGATAPGSEAIHMFRSVGLFTVTLHATNDAARESLDTVVVTVRTNLAPSATIGILLDGQPAERTRVGTELTFTSQARDPEGQPLKHLWDFGDGGSAASATATHAYAAGGRYTVGLRVEDPAGLAATPRAVLAVDQPVGDIGDVSLLSPTTGSHPIPVNALAQQVTIRFTMKDANFGINALVVMLLDADGNEVRNLPAEAGPLAQGPVEVPLDVDSATLGSHAPGAWALVVRHARGINVDYEFTGLVSY